MNTLRSPWFHCFWLFGLQERNRCRLRPQSLYRLFLWRSIQRDRCSSEHLPFFDCNSRPFFRDGRGALRSSLGSQGSAQTFGNFCTAASHHLWANSTGGVETYNSRLAAGNCWAPPQPEGGSSQQQGRRHEGFSWKRFSLGTRHQRTRHTFPHHPPDKKTLAS